MHMRIKRANMKRLASLSALGAGALGVAAGTAEAGILPIPMPANTKIGFSSGFGPSASVVLPGSARIRVSRGSSKSVTSSGWKYSSWWVRLGKATTDWYTAVFFRGGPHGLGIFSAGATWYNTGTGYMPRNNIASRYRTAGTSPGSTWKWCSGNPSFDHKYALIYFVDSAASQWDFGWLRLSLSVGDTWGPDVTLEGGAYDNTGAVIHAGDTGAVPEPSTMALTGLAALALGAAGLRRWRAARKPAA